MQQQHQQQHHVQYAFAPPVHPHPHHQTLPHIQHYQPPATTVAPADTYNTPHVAPPPAPVPGPPASASSSSAAHHQAVGPSTTPGATVQQLAASGAPLIAQGDWTKNLVHLAKTAELKKHALTLQLHTAHIMSAQSQLELKNKAKMDILEQKTKLENERQRLLKALQEVNADRDKADLSEAAIDKECNDLKSRIHAISEGEYAVAKHQVDSLRAELGMSPLPSLQQAMADKSAAYLNERRINGPGPVEMNATPHIVASTSGTGTKRPSMEVEATQLQDTSPSTKRPRGRPKGSKNKQKGSGGSETV